MSARPVWPKAAFLLRLLLQGDARPSATARDEVNALARAGWVAARGNSFHLLDQEAARQRLEAIRPGLEPLAKEIAARGMDPFDEFSYRLAGRDALPRVTNQRDVSRKVVSAALKAHSKVASTPAEAATIGVARPLGDSLFRLRVLSPMSFTNGRVTLDAMRHTEDYGEASVPERFLDGCTCDAPGLTLLVTVENAGAFLDMDLPLGIAAVHAPGTDLTCLGLLRLLPGVPVMHFGDWDQRGYEAASRVAAAAAAVGSRFRWLCPDWLPDYFATHAMGGPKVPWKAVPGRLPSAVAPLASSSRWLEQEAVVMDPRLVHELIRAAS